MMKSDALKSYTEWSVVKEDNMQHATAVHMPTVTVLDGGRIFTRNALKFGIIKSDIRGKYNMLVGELDGVFVYVQQGSIIVTKQELDL